jgi:RNA polymerase sigma factor (TIGR02999 family)
MARAEPGVIKQILDAVGNGNVEASEDLLPLVYSELRRLARILLAKTPPGNTLQPTALVHEAYLRLVGSDDPTWNSRGHFFAAAAEGMRQILVEQARRKKSLRRGGGRKRLESDTVEPIIQPPVIDVLALDEALERLQRSDPAKAQIVLLRYFAGLSREEAAAALNMSVRTLDREWRYIIARLHKEMSDSARPADPSIADGH